MVKQIQNGHRLQWLSIIVLAVSLILGLAGCMSSDDNSQSENNDLPLDYIAPQHYICYQTNQVLEIDGRIDEVDWQKAPWSNYFQDIEGSSKPLPLHNTRIKMLWNENYLFIAAELVEPHIWARLHQRDTVIFYDNDFEVFIDPDGDTHQYYEFEMNALNTVWDLLLVKPYRDGGPAINAWDIQGLKSGVQVNGSINQPSDLDRSWTIEVAFPLAILAECAADHFPPSNGMHWKINFSRVEWTTEVVEGNYRKVINPSTGKPLPENNWVWSPQGHINMHMPENWGILQFSEKGVGEGEDEYIPDPDDYLKWVLRQVYYAQFQYYEDNGQYAVKLKSLELPQSFTSELKGKLHLNASQNQYTVEVLSPYTGFKIVIHNDGLILRKKTD